jgi:hypothetical protein
MYDFDLDIINAVAIKNRKKESLIKGYNELYEELKKSRNQSNTTSTR